MCRPRLHSAIHSLVPPHSPHSHSTIHWIVPTADSSHPFSGNCCLPSSSHPFSGDCRPPSSAMAFGPPFAGVRPPPHRHPPAANRAAVAPTRSSPRQRRLRPPRASRDAPIVLPGCDPLARLELAVTRLPAGAGRYAAHSHPQVPVQPPATALQTACRRRSVFLYPPSIRLAKLPLLLAPAPTFLMDMRSQRSHNVRHGCEVGRRRCCPVVEEPRRSCRPRGRTSPLPG